MTSRINIISKIMTFAIAALVICIILIVSNINSITKKIKSKKGTYIGSKVIINGDTLTVINYSILDESYILSSGLKVDKSIVEK
jgi:hypothetical protein